MFRMLIASLAVLGIVAFGGCKQGAETVAEKAVEKAIEKDGGGKAKVSMDDGKVSIQTKEGSFESAAGGGVKIPEDFPQDVYLPKDANIIASVKSPEGFSLTLQTTEASDQVAAQYTSEMKAQGWEEKMAMNMGEGQMMTYGKDNDTRTVNILVAKSETATQVQITTTTSQPEASN